MEDIDYRIYEVDRPRHLPFLDNQFKPVLNSNMTTTTTISHEPLKISLLYRTKANVNPPSRPRKYRPSKPIETSPTIPIPTSTTAALTTFLVPLQTCHLCDLENPRDFTPTTANLNRCLLCNRTFCPLHKSQSCSTSSVCSTNHAHHHHSRLKKNASESSDSLAKHGIFPSLAERRKYMTLQQRLTTAASEAGSAWAEDLGSYQYDEFQIQRSSNRPWTSRRRSSLIETKEMIGADVAV